MSTQLDCDNWSESFIDADMQRRAQGLPCDAALPAPTPVTTFRCDDQLNAAIAATAGFQRIVSLCPAGG